jgi:hypothetical protein
MVVSPFGVIAIAFPAVGVCVIVVIVVNCMHYAPLFHCWHGLHRVHGSRGCGCMHCASCAVAHGENGVSLPVVICDISSVIIHQCA